MKSFRFIVIIILSGILIFSCKPSGPKTMTPEDFLKMESEYINTDRSLESQEAIVKKYGYTVKDYTDFEDRVEKDPELKKQLGEIQLKNQK